MKDAFYYSPADGYKHRVTKVLPIKKGSMGDKRIIGMLEYEDSNATGGRMGRFIRLNDELVLKAAKAHAATLGVPLRELLQGR